MVAAVWVSVNLIEDLVEPVLVLWPEHAQKFCARV